MNNYAVAKQLSVVFYQNRSKVKNWENLETEF